MAVADCSGLAPMAAKPASAMPKVAIDPVMDATKPAK